jgi:predicted esterase
MTATTSALNHPHGGQPILRKGADPASARLGVILVHGRGGSADEMLSLADEFRAKDVSWVAPQAAGHTWYPFSFLAPMEQNEPGITSGLRVLSDLVAEFTAAGMPAERVGILGFSQGACLALEFVARHAARYAAVAGLSGGLIGPPGTPRNYEGSLAGTPIFLGCSDVDPHIPVERVRESTQVFRHMGASVDERIYPGMGHTISRDELTAVRRLFGPG